MTLMLSNLLFQSSGTVNCVSFNEESTVILSGSIDGKVKVWDCRSRKMEPIQVFIDQ